MTERDLEIFDEAAEIEDQARRQAYLEEACGADQALRQRVEALLKAHLAISGSEGFLGGSEGLERVRKESDPDGAILIGRYRLLQKIGEGGCGLVFMADQQEPVRRRVALKLIKPGMDTRQVLARFEAERQALAMMDHPNIARVLDAGATESGRPYFVMELVRGIPITQYCEQNRLDLGQRLRLFVTVCQAVQHAHLKGIIHRDIKPSNILVSSDDGQPLAKVIDFGVAKATTDIQLTDKTLFTRFEMFVGTPAYMSPEQAEFNVQGVDTRTDVYSLGVLLYELLTGKPPFDNRTLNGVGVDEMRRIIREVDPPRPRARIRTTEEALRKGSGQDPVPGSRSWVAQGLFSADLDWIAMKALEKDRTRRYETASALAQDVQRYLDNEPVSARPPGMRYVITKWARRHRALFGAVSGVAVALVLGSGVSGWLAWRARQAEQHQRELRIQADAARADAVTRAYAADMKATGVALMDGNRGHATALLERYEPRPGEPDIRGVEWHLLRSRASGDEVASFDHTGMSAGVVLDPSGRWIAAVARFGPLRIWDVVSGELLREIPSLRKREPRRSLALSPDGQHLVHLGDERIWLRRTTDWSLVWEYPAQANVVQFTPDGLVAFVGDGRLRFLDPATTNLVSDFPKFTSDAGSLLSFSADGKLFLLRDAQGVVLVGERVTGSVQRQFNRERYAAAVLSPDGRRVATGSGDGMLRLWDVGSGDLVAETRAHTAWMLDAAFSPDSRRIVTGGGDQLIRLWDATGDKPLSEELGRWTGHWNEVWTVAFAEDGRILSAGKDAKVKIWGASSPVVRARDIPMKQPAFQHGYSVAGDWVCVREQDRLLFYRVADGSLLREWKVPGDCRPEMTDWRGPDETWFATTNGTVVVHRLPDGQRMRTIECPDLSVQAVGSVTSDRRVMSVRVARSSDVALVEVETGKLIRRLPDFVLMMGTPAANRVAFSPDGTKVAYTATDRRVRICSVADGRVLRELEGFAWHLYCLLWSQDGKTLVTSSWDGAVKVWDVEAGRQRLPALMGHFSGVPSLSFSPDGRTLVTHGADSTVRFWNLATGTEVLTLPNADAYWGCPISPDGKTFSWRRHPERHLRIERLR